MTSEFIIIAALLLDFVLGDPLWFPHPVRGIGIFASSCEHLLRRIFISKALRFAGILAAIVIIGSCGVFSWSIIFFFTKLHSIAGIFASIFFIYVSIAPRDLYDHSIAVFNALKSDTISLAREKVAMIVGRDVENLNESEIVRACVETIGESLVDGVTAPLFYALLFGPVGAFVYRAINTLDSMFGHKNEKYLYFGWASARIDDIANFVPARLTAPFIFLSSLLLRMNTIGAIKIFIRDKQNHHSPNSGLSEAAFAGALSVQLGGLNYYDGEADQKPLIGINKKALDKYDIRKANYLMFSTTILFCLTGVILKIFL